MSEKTRWEIYPPTFDADGALADFRRDLAAIGIRSGEMEGDALQILRDVIHLCQMGASIPQLAQKIGTGVHPGVFWTYLSWLQECGILMRADDSDRFYVLGPYGTSLLAGFRIFGVDVDRWRAIPFPDDEGR